MKLIPHGLDAAWHDGHLHAFRRLRSERIGTRRSAALDCGALTHFPMSLAVSSFAPSAARERSQDPIILTEEFPSVTPTTLIIRTEKIAQLNPSEDVGILFYLRVRATNSSGHPWVEFEFELQEQLNVPSDYGDGLSFYQPGDKRGMIQSTGYGTISDDFEPYDRMVFRDGKIDPGFWCEF